MEVPMPAKTNTKKRTAHCLKVAASKKRCWRGSYLMGIDLYPSFEEATMLEWLAKHIPSVVVSGLRRKDCTASPTVINGVSPSQKTT